MTPDEAVIKLNVRTFDEDVRKRVLAAIERIVNAEADASRAPQKPEITPLGRYALVKNDSEATKRGVDAFRSYFPAERVKDTQPSTASEDFGSFGIEWQVPSVSGLKVAPILRHMLRLGGPAQLPSAIALADFLVALMKGSRIGAIVRESLTIGGWVSMWRPLEIF